MKSLGVAEIVDVAIRREAWNRGRRSNSSGERIVDRNCLSLPSDGTRYDWIERDRRRSAQHDLLRIGKFRNSSDLRFQALRFGNPRRVCLHHDVQIIFERQRNRVFQAQHQLAVLNKLVQARRIRQHRLRTFGCGIRPNNVREERLSLGIVRAETHLHRARFFCGGGLRLLLELASGRLLRLSWLSLSGRLLGLRWLGLVRLPLLPLLVRRWSPLAWRILTFLSLSKDWRNDQRKNHQSHQNGVRKASNHRRFSSQHEWDVEALAHFTLPKRAHIPLCFK